MKKHILSGPFLITQYSVPVKVMTETTRSTVVVLYNLHDCRFVHRDGACRRTKNACSSMFNVQRSTLNKAEVKIHNVNTTRSQSESQNQLSAQEKSIHQGRPFTRGARPLVFQELFQARCDLDGLRQFPRKSPRPSPGATLGCKAVMVIFHTSTSSASPVASSSFFRS